MQVFLIPISYKKFCKKRPKLNTPSSIGTSAIVASSVHKDLNICHRYQTASLKTFLTRNYFIVHQCTISITTFLTGSEPLGSTMFFYSETLGRISRHKSLSSLSIFCAIVMKTFYLFMETCTQMILI